MPLNSLNVTQHPCLI